MKSKKIILVTGAAGFIGYHLCEALLKIVQNITYVASKYDVLKDSDALVLLTEWKEFRSPDFEEMETQLKSPVIFDGRNQYNTFSLEEKGFEYYQIGKK